eukprot:g2387.t1
MLDAARRAHPSPVSAVADMTQGSSLCALLLRRAVRHAQWRSARWLLQGMVDTGLGLDRRVRSAVIRYGFTMPALPPASPDPNPDHSPDPDAARAEAEAEWERAMELLDLVPLLLPPAEWLARGQEELQRRARASDAVDGRDDDRASAGARGRGAGYDDQFVAQLYEYGSTSSSSAPPSFDFDFDYDRALVP